MPAQIHYPYPDPPAGYQWEEFEYTFDSTNTPALETQLSAGQTLRSIPLALQTDAEFLIRAIQINNPQQNLGVRFTDAFGRLISDDFVTSYTYSSFQPVNGSLPGILPVVFEPALPCPKGAVLLIDLANLG
jgi:hypothetical protein